VSSPRPSRIVDAHVHVACADAERYPRKPNGLGRPWWETDGEAEQLRANLDANGVGRTVIVHAGGLYGYECECSADVVAAAPDRYALVPEVNVRADDLDLEVARFAAMGATGIRVAAVGGGDAPWLGDGRGARIWRGAAAHGLVVGPTVFPKHLADLVGVCREVPDATVVVDHCAFAHLGDDAVQAQVLALADVPSIHLKVTTYNVAVDDPRQWLARCIDAFGADRLCWGTDYPQVPDLTYAEMLDAALVAASDLAPAERDALFAGTAARLWFRAR
jgi:L-fuconolactonase